MLLNGFRVLARGKAYKMCTASQARDFEPEMGSGFRVLALGYSVLGLGLRV